MPSESVPTRSAVQSLLKQLDEIEQGAGGGVLRLPALSGSEGPGGERLEVSNLGKVFWPGGSGRTRPTLTKGDLFRHYVRVARLILPVLADRPLVMKRYPNGVAAPPFYQHRAPDKVPAGVRIERVDAGTETRPHLVGGSLMTLLYTAQLASVSQDPWFSRVGSADTIVEHTRVRQSVRRILLATIVATICAKSVGGSGRGRVAEGFHRPEFRGADEDGGRSVGGTENCQGARPEGAVETNHEGHEEHEEIEFFTS